MAITFISPRRRRKILFWSTALILVLFLIVISLFVFLPDFLNTSYSTISQPNPTDNPDLAINLSVLDSNKVKSLEQFTNLEITFAYVVADQTGKQITGTISAATKEDAQKMLEAGGFSVVSITEVSPGKSNPFVSY